MNLTKSSEYFDPLMDNARIHIVGCGSVGSTLAENLARCGCTNFELYDFDTVEPHNISNQMFNESHVGAPKIDALVDILTSINPEIKHTVKLHPKGWKGRMMSGYIFLCVDDIQIRKDIVEKHFNSPYVKAVFDFRTVLESAMHYAADWKNQKEKQMLLDSMQFSHEEAMEEAPVSACGITLGVSPTVRAICAFGVANYINFVKGKKLKHFINCDVFNFILDAF